MKQTSFPKGSEWRKWDLHVHTPISSGFNGSWEQFEAQIKRADCAVIGVNDYFSIEGYRILKARIASGDLDLGDKTILPVVEFRMRDVIRNKHSAKSGTRINFHVVFSDEIDIAKIETFLRGLEVDKRQIADRYSDAEFLREKASVYFADDVVHKLTVNPDFQEKFIVWLPYDEHGGIDDIDPMTDDWVKSGLIRDAHLLGSSKQKQIDFFLWKSSLGPDGKPKFSEEQFRMWFESKKPCVKGSDSHDHSDTIGCLKDHNSNPTNKYCWIKADPTFSGLQRVIAEPDERVYIGVSPEKLSDVENYRQNYIANIKIGQRKTTKSLKWFDDVLLLNPGLVSIIGRKGSGKSALTDVLALTGQSRIPPLEYSFLRKDKFREGGLASAYVATLTWADSSTTTMSLDQTVDAVTQVEKVRYLPQRYVETICNETGVSVKFQEEIDKVVFSYVSDFDRLGASNLQGLIQKRTSAIVDRLAQLRNDLSNKIGKLITLENMVASEYRKGLQNRLDDKEKQLKALQMPAKVKKPLRADPALQGKLKAKQAEYKKLTGLVKQLQQDLKVVNEKLNSVGNIEHRVNMLGDEVQELQREIKPDLDLLELEFGKVVKITVERRELKRLRSQLLVSKEKLEQQLGKKPIPSGAKVQNLNNNLKALEREIQAAKEGLDAKNLVYQQYLQDLDEYKRRHLAIVGEKDIKDGDTLNALKAQMEYLGAGLKKDIEGLEKSIDELTEKIFAAVSEKLEVFRDIYRPLTEFVQTESKAQGAAQSVLTFDVGFVADKELFASTFLSHIDHSRDGSFQQSAPARERILQILSSHRFDSSKSVLEFIDDVLDNLRFDRSSAVTKKMKVADQLRSGATRYHDLLQWIQALEYIDVRFGLKFNGKDLNGAKFSPGERGTILLIFYLLIDKEKVPLIIDQPEENLDNESVFRLLVPYIKRAKTRRQVIIATHNPNLAVNCDSEQIIVANMDKESNEIRYVSGSIEELETNKKLSDVLEGTLPAFRQRDRAYLAKQ